MSAEQHTADNDETFEAAEAGSAKTHPVQCSALRKNGHVLIKNHPCKIVEMSTSKTGKHGHAKVHLVGIDIFLGTKHEENCPSTHNVLVPHVTREEFVITDGTEDGYLVLMTDKGEERRDLKMDPPKNCSSEYEKIYYELEKRKNKETIEGESAAESCLYHATVTCCMGMEKVLDVKKKSE